MSERKHALLSPSAAPRWMECTAAPGLEADLTEKPSPYAQEGTRAHALAEYEARLAVGLDTAETPTEADDAEMQDAAKFYAAYVKEAYLTAKENCADAMIEMETRLDLTNWIPEGFGTADCLIVADGTLHVIDFKYGKGVQVDAAGNKQMQIYALGALHWAGLLYDIDNVEMTIIQPRINANSAASLPADELLLWGAKELAPAAQKAFTGEGARFSPGEDTCRFCKAAGSCKARADYFVALFDENKDATLSPAEAGDVLSRAASMKDWLQALEETVKDACLAGADIPGWKIVEGRTRRQYTDEAEIEKRLRAKKYKVSEIYEKKLLGITKMEKLIGKKQMEEIIGDLIEKPQGAPTLVPEDDKRPAWDPEAETLQAFDE